MCRIKLLNDVFGLIDLLSGYYVITSCHVTDKTHNCSGYVNVIDWISAETRFFSSLTFSFCIIGIRKMQEYTDDNKDYHHNGYLGKHSCQHQQTNKCQTAATAAAVIFRTHYKVP